MSLESDLYADIWLINLKTMSEIQTKPTATEKEIFTRMILANWQSQNRQMNALLGKLSDADLAAETAPGRNTGVYLLGHLAAVSDGLFTILGFGDRVNPAMEEVFIRNPDKSGLETPSTAELREYWNKVNTELEPHINAVQPDEWFGRHMSVSEEDFAKEPHRNKLNVIISRTTHLAYHLGQLVYLEKK
jgi:hypothetical protein